MNFVAYMVIVLSYSADLPRLKQNFSDAVHMKNMPCISALMMRSRRRTPRSMPCSTNSRACKKNNAFSLEAECYEAERRAAATPVFAEGASTVRFASPVEKVATVADFHSPDMSLGASAGNMNLKTRTAGQTMVINARRRLGMKTTPQPVEPIAKAKAEAVGRPVRRMRSKGPLQTVDFHKSPNPGGDPPYDHAGGGGLEGQGARGSGGVPSPPGLPSASEPRRSSGRLW